MKAIRIEQPNQVSLVDLPVSQRWEGVKKAQILPHL